MVLGDTALNNTRKTWTPNSHSKRGKGGHLPNSQTYIYIYIHTGACEINFSIENDWWETSKMGSEMEGIRERQMVRFDTG